MGRRRAFRRVLYGRTKYGTDSSDNGGLLLAYYSLSVPSAFPSSSLPTSFSLSSSFSSSGFTAIDVSISYRRMGTCPNINRDLGALFVFFLLSFLFFFLPFTSNADKRFNHSTNLPPFCVEIRCDWNVFIPCLPTLEFRSIFIWFILWNAHEIKCRRWNKNQ